MLDLTNVLELFIDRLAQRSLAQEYFVEHRHQLFFIFFLILVINCALCSQSRAKSTFENISAVAEELPEKSPREARSRLTIIYVHRRDHHGLSLAHFYVELRLTIAKLSNYLRRSNSFEAFAFR